MRTVLPLLMLGALLASAGVAWAHGGNFRNASPQGPGIQSPDLAPGPRSKPTTEDAAWLTGDWHTWWNLNRGALLPDKRAVRGRVAATQSAGLFRVGRVRKGGLEPWGRSLDLGARATALPLLLELLDPNQRQDERLVAAALVALGRIARDSAPAAILRRYARRVDLCEEVRESAVLGLGLLRRSRRDQQFGVDVLRDVRRFLLDRFDDEGAGVRVRAFAAFGLGLLADQPYPDDAFARDGRLLTQALWQRLGRRYPSAELPVALLTALGMQPRRSVAAGVLEGLRAIAVGRALRGRRWDPLGRSHALSAYMRLDGTEWLPMALGVLHGSREHVAVRAAAAIALARRAGDLGDDERALVAHSLLQALPREPHWFVEGLEQIALGHLLREDLAVGGTPAVTRLRIDRMLRREAIKGRSMTRPYAALALGLSVRGVEPVSRTSATAVAAIHAALLRGLQHGRGADDVLAAYAVGLGVAGAGSGYHVLLDVLSDRKRAARLRACCAVALAQLGSATPALREALQAAARERVSPLVHGAAVKALALLAAPGTTQDLLHQLETTRSRHAVAVVAGALGRFGDPAAAEPLTRVARDRTAATGVRTMAVVALGLIFDPEVRPSRVLLSTHANYPSRTASLTQLFNIL